MGWLWTLQIILDVLILVGLWKWLKSRQQAPMDSSSDGLTREELQRYCETMSELSDRLQNESEKLTQRLEQGVRSARQVLEHLERPRSTPAESGWVERPVVQKPSLTGDETEAGPTSQTQQEVYQLHRQGYTVEQIARHLHLGQREVHLLLSLQRTR